MVRTKRSLTSAEIREDLVKALKGTRQYGSDEAAFWYSKWRADVQTLLAKIDRLNGDLEALKNAAGRL